MLLERLVVNEFGLYSNSQKTSTQDIIYEIEGVKVVPENPTVSWMALWDGEIGLFPVFNPRKNDAKTPCALFASYSLFLFLFEFRLD